ncbi:MAG: FAD-binding oxidoreductase [Gammaproteobacteria bacterium]|nr:FAD-binding oxidoreductase [Gammaproteobacteria bacterium]
MNVEKSLWQASSKETINTDPLDENITTDLVIIGGGYTGCSAALHAAKSGMDVQLLEADTIGFGGSGRNVGLVNAGLWLPPLEVENIMGEKSGTKLNTLLAKAPDLVFSLIERYQIQCDSVRSGTLHCAHSRKGFVDLQSRYKQLTDRGAPVSLLGAVARIPEE